MQTIAYLNNQKQIQTTVSELVAALTTEENSDLRNFAAQRLKRVARWAQMQRILAGLTADDLVNSAIAKYLVGDVHPKKGRVLKSKGRQSTEAFLHCLRGAINSELHNLRTSAESQGIHVSASDEDTQRPSVPVLEPLDPMSLLERRDIRRVLFERLNQVLEKEPALTPVVSHWSEHFDVADRIAGPEFDHNLIERVRQHARQILCDLAREITPKSPVGIEML